MGNTSSTSHGNEQGTRGRFLQNLTRNTVTSVRRLLRNRRTRESRFRRNSDFDSFERLLREEFSVEDTSDSDIAEHLISIHVSCTETPRNCTIYVTGYNNSHDKVIEGIVDQDLTRDCESDFYITYTEPQAERSFNRHFKFPFQATEIKEFFDRFSSKPEDNA